MVQAFQLVVDTIYFVRHGLRTPEKTIIDKTLERGHDQEVARCIEPTVKLLRTAIYYR